MSTVDSEVASLLINLHGVFENEKKDGGLYTSFFELNKGNKMIFNYCIGPAGSGKTTLIATTYNYLTEKYKELRIITVNLDPGVRNLPYTPHIDIRDYILLEEVMERYGLGPNGGLVAATDMIIDSIEDLKFEISEYNNPDVVLIDTPGQMELFAFRNTGPMVVSSLGYGDVQKVVSFLFDPTICRHPSGYISTMFLAGSVLYRFANIPQINVLSKSDLLEPDILERVLAWSEDYDKLFLATDKTERGLVRELDSGISEIFERLQNFPRLLSVSSLEFTGIEEYWGAIQRTLNFDESPYY
ncbi:MAG: ATP/GTP-binding protein [Candidatus Lokiarchaeota archaeon]|nr:ATP/GTP-binding protein [Candidatus Lokiarchaeota archaeon]